ncbi:MAG TPA: reverse transcriptase domain-containing protein [Candidatus Dojkabacteria bacterium]|nr:reverse transcriptase domain-containing protein [Candidatus Dojkabacteria bacterium]
MRTANKDCPMVVYGLFVDFANAYNTVAHTLLFQKLRTKNCLDEEEIQYLEALYSRYRIRVGNRVIRYNRGVAQGSLLSPALFNIFIEDLVEEISREVGVRLEDVLLYADDLLVLCTSMNQLNKCIEIIERWAKVNGMELNKRKSGIIPFTSRKAHNIPFMELRKFESKGKKPEGKRWEVARKELNGVPIVEKYKYLGSYLSAKLTMDEQIQFIKRKFGWLFTKLYPYLAVASADARRDMWWTMMAPMFNAVLVIMTEEESDSRRMEIQKLWMYTFKKFMLIPKTTYNTIVLAMIGKDLLTMGDVNHINAGKKWEMRKAENKDDFKFLKLEGLNLLKGISNDWCTILRLQCRLCPRCGTKPRGYIMSSRHMEEVHGIEVVSCMEIWKEIEKFHLYQIDKLKNKKKKKFGERLKRKVFQEKWGEFLKEIRVDMEGKFNEFISGRIHKTQE